MAKLYRLLLLALAEDSISDANISVLSLSLVRGEEMSVGRNGDSRIDPNVCVYIARAGSFSSGNGQYIVRRSEHGSR